MKLLTAIRILHGIRGRKYILMNTSITETLAKKKIEEYPKTQKLLKLFRII